MGNSSNKSYHHPRRKYASQVNRVFEKKKKRNLYISLFFSLIFVSEME